MAELTISEALKEIETIGKRLVVKKTGVLGLVARAAQLKDPLANDGGAVEFIARERQAIGDLEQRIVDLRTSIQDSNLNTELTVGKTTQTVAEWLTWRKEVSAGRKQFLRDINLAINTARNNVVVRGGKATDNEKDAVAGDVIVHLNEKALLADLENIETVLGELDGKLSVRNATTAIEV